jgi:hypothetical protein
MRKQLLAAAAVVGLAGLAGYRRIQRARAVLMEVIHVDEQLAAEAPYRLPLTAEPVIVPTVRGEFTLVVATGYFSGAGIFVLFPEGESLSEELATAFKEATDGRFCMERPPSLGASDSNPSVVIITAGLNYSAFRRGEAGYFKEGPAPRLDETAAILAQIIV